MFRKRKILSGNKSQKKLEQRRWWRRNDIDRGLLPSRTSHNTIHTKHAIWTFVKLCEGLRLPFLFWMVRKKSKHHDRDIDHPAELLHFAEHPQSLKTVNWKDLVVTWHTATATGYRITLCCVICKMNNSTSQTSVCLVHSFHSASFRVRFSIRALPSLPHFIISF